MDIDLPKRNVIYRGPIVDSTRWDQFKVRDDDIFVCVPGKSGTTWTQTICALLIFGTADLDIRPSVISPWLDVTFQPLDEILAMLEAQTHRRYIKTHTPLDGIPFFPQCTYLNVYRDPRDVFFSMRNHAGNMWDERLAHRASAPVSEVFREWAEYPYSPGDPELFSLGAYVHHYLSYGRYLNLANVHRFHYADMKRDRGTAMRGMAGALGIEVSEPIMAELIEAASFDNMKFKAEQFAPESKKGAWKDIGRFFNKGSNAQWLDQLTAEDLALYHARIEALLPAEDIAWLHAGDGPAG